MAIRKSIYLSTGAVVVVTILAIAGFLARGGGNVMPGAVIASHAVLPEMNSGGIAPVVTNDYGWHRNDFAADPNYDRREH